MVNRDRYVAGMERRIRVCPTFGEVVLDPTRLREQLPEEESVPPAFVQAAVPMPEIRNLNTTRDGPATRRDQLGPAPEGSQSDAPSSEDAAADAAGADTPGAGNPPSTEPTSDAPGTAPEDDRNEYEHIIGIDTHEAEPEERLFQTFHARASVVKTATERLARSNRSRNARADASAPTAPETLSQGVAAAAASFQCQQLVVDM